MKCTPFVCLWSAAAITLLLSSPLAYSQEVDNNVPATLETASTKCFATLADPRMTVCVSDHGNIVRFESPTAWQHINREGFAVCASFAPLLPPPAPPPLIFVAYDAGSSEAGW